MIPYATHDGRPMTQPEVAEWMGYGDDVAAMNAEHDNLHFALCARLHIISHSLRDADGKALTPEERMLADLEEHAVCAVQRLLQHHRRQKRSYAVEGAETAAEALV